LKGLFKVRDGDFTPELLQRTAELLKTNPEYYTMWNHRRRIYAKEFISIRENYMQGELTADNRDSQILDIIQLDLQFLLPLLMQFPKCYWIWNHRVWLLEQTTTLLPAAKARPIWEEELRLVGKMLTRDNRNFHGWGYRRIIIDNLESKVLDGQSMALEELDYTTKMIRTNLSNFSAWHSRTKLTTRILDEKSATDEERKQMLDEGGMYECDGDLLEADLSRACAYPQSALRPVRSVALVLSPEPSVHLRPRSSIPDPSAQPQQPCSAGLSLQGGSIHHGHSRRCQRLQMDLSGFDRLQTADCETPGIHV
jgi:Protein prenyltransferase alpha subunit repeat